MKRPCALLPALVLVLGGCNSDLGRVFGNAFLDELRGTPSASALAESEHFAQAGISFDYPKVLRLRSDHEGADDLEWNLEYGLFTLQLSASKSPQRAADYLELLAEVYASGTSIDSEAPVPGRAAVLCGQPLTSTRIRVKILGDWSQIDAFDLPAPAGESRMLLFDDEPVNGQASAVAAATWERVLGSLRCDPTFTHGADVASPEDA